MATVFAVQGLSQTVNAYSAVENAQRRLAQLQERTQLPPTLRQHQALENAQATAAQAATAQVLTAQRQAAATATAVVAAFSAVAAVVKRATDAYSEFGTEVMNIRDLTGASARQAAQAASLFRAAGVQDMQSIRDVLQLSKAMFSNEGISALSKLGVPANMNQSGLALFNQIADALQRYPSGIMKAQIETEIFGTRGVAALQGLLRMTKDQRSAVMELSDANDRNLGTLQQYQFASALLGETIQQRIVYPILEKLLPTMLMAINAVTWLANAFGKINQATGGFLGIAAAMFVIGAATVAAVTAFTRLAAALRLASVWQAVLDALSGNWRNLAVGAAVAAGVGLTIYGFDRLVNQSGPQSSGLDANTSALQQNTAALNLWVDNFASFNHGGIPGGLSKYDVQQLARMRALGAIG